MKKLTLALLSLLLPIIAMAAQDPGTQNANGNSRAPAQVNEAASAPANASADGSDNTDDSHWQNNDRIRTNEAHPAGTSRERQSH